MMLFKNIGDDGCFPTENLTEMKGKACSLMMCIYHKLENKSLELDGIYKIFKLLESGMNVILLSKDIA